MFASSQVFKFFSSNSCRAQTIAFMFHARKVRAVSKLINYVDKALMTRNIEKGSDFSEKVFFIRGWDLAHGDERAQYAIIPYLHILERPSHF